MATMWLLEIDGICKTLSKPVLKLGKNVLRHSGYGMCLKLYVLGSNNHNTHQPCKICKSKHLMSKRKISAVKAYTINIFTCFFLKKAPKLRVLKMLINMLEDNYALSWYHLNVVLN